ncbi:ubiquitin thioesterase ZRANB1 [Eurytemora carolleeae]|uniref:ubiquitin thioesterase ZRANB1 n=1 Tax=Eurytemora carolleeae TaxID=1294199 RepID=UPI000C778B62|nr:ubiquitin thioesterase ZRANB1 [Eurytemora carolleeae]|eukprot:XP_023343890.1 ubiquitin thioesterase ZRANB1-like [Eurytemora affinis]
MQPVTPDSEFTKRERKWRCDYCTYDNWPTTTKCVMCRGQKPGGFSQGQDIYSLDRMERPPSPPGQNIFNLEGGGGGGGGGAQVYECEPMKWACVNCTYFNYSR